MCLAHVLKFRCKHSLLMSIEFCKLGPCMRIKTTSPKLPRQPFRCYSCEHRRTSSSPTSPPTRPACATSISSIDSTMSKLSMSSSEPSSPPPMYRVMTAPLPGVARQPTGTLSYCQNISQPRPKSAKSFSFSCSSNNHSCTPHYTNLPTFLPHQNHPCPPCQFEDYKAHEMADTARRARLRFPQLTDEMLVVNGRKQEGWQSTLTEEIYVAEECTRERELWLHTYRAWTQELAKTNVLLSAEDGLALAVEF
jgi:hypothetical protein